MSRSLDRYKRVKRLSWAVVEVEFSPPSPAAAVFHSVLQAAYNKAQAVYPDGLPVPEWMQACDSSNKKGP